MEVPVGLSHCHPRDTVISYLCLEIPPFLIACSAIQLLQNIYQIGQFEHSVVEKWPHRGSKALQGVRR